MNYIRLWKQAENRLILSNSINLMKRLKQYNNINFVRVRIKSWDELVNSYGISSDGSIYIRENVTYFLPEMKKFCGEEFEIAIDLGKDKLFRIIDRCNSWIITKHEVDIIESTGFEINKNWPIIEMLAKMTTQTMWENLYEGCNKFEQKILKKLIEDEENLNKKNVKIKSWGQLLNEYELDNEGDIRLAKEDISFVRPMKTLCGQEFMAEYRDDSYIIGYLSNGYGNWTITRGMVTEI